jgi:glucose-6-phosphate 1-dehydrogenase
MRSVEMDFHYRDSFGDALPEAYEKLLLDALEGDASLFTRSDAIEASWKLIDPVLQAWGRQNRPEMTSYTPGTWGPDAADALLAQGSRTWLLNCGEHA